MRPIRKENTAAGAEETNSASWGKVSILDTSGVWKCWLLKKLDWLV